LKLRPPRLGQNPPRRRAPHGARGLKRHAWVGEPHLNYSRAPHGARGLKHGGALGLHAGEDGRAPHGARGLKRFVLARHR